MSVLNQVSPSFGPLPFVLLLAASFEFERLPDARPVIFGKKPLLFSGSNLLFFLLLRFTILLFERLMSAGVASLMKWPKIEGITVLQKFET